MSEGNGDFPSVIVLATGYKVDIGENYQGHLLNAIVREMVVRPVTEEVYDLDTGLRLALSECDRISALYRIPYKDLILGFFRTLVKMIGSIEGGDEKE